MTDPSPPKRKNSRLPGYDYGQNGAYFVTICTNARQPFFGVIVSGDTVPPNGDSGFLPSVGAAHPGGPHVKLSDIGILVEEHLRSIPRVYPHVALAAHIVMPDHIHAILVLHPQGGPPGCAAPTSLPRVINAFKSLCTRAATHPLWQRGYYEHVLRNQRDFDEAAGYIQGNPARWLERHK